MISMVRPDSLEQRSARRGVCPRSPAAAAAAATHAAARPGFSFTGFLFVLFSPPAEVHEISPKGAGEPVAWGLLGCAVVSGCGAGVGVASAGSAPAFSRAESRPRAGVGSAATVGAQPPPSPHRREGSGRHSPETWRERDGRSAGALLAASRGPSRSRRRLLCFCRPFHAFEWPGGRRPLGAAERAGASARTPPHLFSFQSCRLRRGRRPGLPRAPAPL